MSLLQDALRRVQKNPDAPPAPPSPFPDSPPPGPRTRWGLLLGLTAAAFLVGAATIFLLGRRSDPPAVPSWGSPATPPAAARPALPAVPAPPPQASAGPAVPAAHTASPPLQARTIPPVERRHDAPARRAFRGGEGKALPVETFNAAAGALDRGETTEAVRLFREAIAKSPDLVEAWNGLGLGLLRMKDLEGADAALTRALALAPRYVPALLNAGLLRLEQGRVPEAAGLFSRAAALSPESPAPRVNLAVAQLRLGMPGEAEETLLAARRRFPGDADVLYQLGAMYERAGARERSAEAYSAFLSASGGVRPDREARVRERLRFWAVANPLDAEFPRPSQ